MSKDSSRNSEVRSFREIRIQAYKRMMRPLKPHLYSLVCTIINQTGSGDGLLVTWNDGEILVDPPIEDERERGYAEASTKWLAFFLLFIPVFWLGVGVFAIESVTLLWYVDSLLFFVFSGILLASTHGLEPPTISSNEEADQS